MAWWHVAHRRVWWYYYYSSEPALRRCGFGFACLSDDSSFAWGAFAPLPGSVQTVPRSELYAVLAVVLFACPSADLVVVTDSQITADTFRAGWEALDVRSRNLDLWAALFALVRSRPGRVALLWVKAHCLDDPSLIRSYCVPFEHVIGNACADVLADRGAGLAAAAGDDVYAYRRLSLLVHRIQTRRVAVLHHLVVHFPREMSGSRPLSRPPRLPLSGHALASQHVAIVVGSRWLCAACGCGLAAGASRVQVLEWFATACCPNRRAAVLHLDSVLGSSACRPVFVPAACPVVLKDVLVHSSHRLFVFRGVFCCSVCGHLAGHHLRLLRAVCPGVALESGRRNVARLRAGLLPWGVKAWPRVPVSRQGFFGSVASPSRFA